MNAVRVRVRLPLRWSRPGPWLAAGALAAVAVWRFVQVDRLVFPAWVDSVHHVLVVRILLEQGRLPESWAPYLPAVPFYYHFGFHLSAAVLARLMGLSDLGLAPAVVWAGQLWQIGLAAGLLRLAHRVLRQWPPAIGALLLAGFVSPMPAVYSTWGRYSLLAGLTCTVWGMVCVLSRRPAATASLVALAAITHYYAFCLLVSFLGLHLALARSRRPALAGAAGGLVLAAPWLLHVWSWTRALHRGVPVLAGGAPSSEVSPAALLGPARNYIVLGCAVAGLLAIAGRRHHPPTHARRAGLAFVAWTLGLIALMGPCSIGPFRPDHAATVLFVPGAILAAGGLWSALPPAAAWTAVIALAIWGGAETRDITHAGAAIGGAEDVAALRWIARETPSDATFLVDAVPWMGVWRGVDGGWWITPLTGRRTVPPPVAYSWGPPELAVLARAAGRRIHELSGTPLPEYCSALEDLFHQTGAAFYYTRSARPSRCSGLRLRHRAGGGPGIWSLADDEPP